MSLRESQEVEEELGLVMSVVGIQVTETGPQVFKCRGGEAGGVGMCGWGCGLFLGLVPAADLGQLGRDLRSPIHQISSNILAPVPGVPGPRDEEGRSILGREMAEPD